VLRYLSDSSYYIYLAHVPLLLFLQVAFATVPLHWTVKFPLILVIGLTVLLMSYHYLVRPTFVGELLNGRRYRRRKGPWTALFLFLGQTPEGAS
jgi:peptidoglycan/LPS O-acetylase OafA/YrhL